jgi:gliding motility-associated-like protein
MMFVWVSSAALASGQNFYTVNRGSVHEYNVAKTATNITYNWQVFTDASLTTMADDSQVILTQLGTGLENEIRVSWLTEGDYYLLVSLVDAKSCSNRKGWHFVVSSTDDKPTARILGASTVSLGNCDSNGYVIDASTSTGGGLVYNWSPSIYLSNVTTSKPKFVPGKTTQYILTVTDDRGQTDTASITMVVDIAPEAITDKNVFVSDPNSSILLDGSRSKGVGRTYLWTSKDGLITNGDTSPMAEVSGLGMYYLNVTDSHGCSSLDSVQVNLYTLAEKDTASTTVNFAVEVNVLANDIPLNNLDPSTLKIARSPANGFAVVLSDSVISYAPNPYYVGPDSFTYSICDFFQNCSEAVVLVMINDVPFFTPQAFSPNGDGLNDQFEIKGLEKYKAVQIEIFNRWGNIVFQSGNYGEGNEKEGFWDGIGQSRLGNKTGPVPTGTYFYVLKMNGSNTISGSVYLDR